MTSEEKLNLYDYNKKASKKISDAFLNSDVVAIVHATGTGKSYNALKLILDNPDKKFIYLVPSNGIIEHLKEIINDNPYISLDVDFKNVEFRTYQSLINLSYDEITSLDLDMLILDEFHHLGAPVWGARVNTLINLHPGIKILGMSAYTVRDRGSLYERDMTNEEANELFSNKIVSRYDLADAIIDGVLPNVVYKSSHINLLEDLNNLDQRVSDEDELKKLIEDLKKRIHEAPSISDILKKNLKKDGKYIYFCPPYCETGVNDIDSIIEIAKTWLKEMGLSDSDYEIYKTTSDMGLLGKKNRNAFYHDSDLDGMDTSNKLRIMFAVNQYNEGVHAPNVDGVIMGRGTHSDIVFFEQLGRALSVRGNTYNDYEQYNKYSLDELKLICKDRDIVINDNMSKDDIIYKLLSPVVIDLADNYEFIRKLENNLKDRVKEVSVNKEHNKRNIHLRSLYFDIDMDNQDLYDTLTDLKAKVYDSWNKLFELAKRYYEYHGDLEIPFKFITKNGYDYDEDGIKLGVWITTQRNNKNLSDDRRNMLLSIGMRFEKIIKRLSWIDAYNLAKKYYEHYGNIDIPNTFKTSDGITYDNDGFSLGSWLYHQKIGKTLTEEQKRLLNEINVLNNYSSNKDRWEEQYELAKKYYEHYGHLNIPQSFKTKNGYDYEEDGVNLGRWLANQRSKKNASDERRNKLIQIGFKYNENRVDLWNKMFDLAQKYYEHYGNLSVPVKFKTKNGIDYDEDGIYLGDWIRNQRYHGNLSDDQRKKLDLIGMRFDKVLEDWNYMYDLAKKYYEYHGNLEVPFKFITKNGVKLDICGYSLGSWIYQQRKNSNLSAEKKEKLCLIGMRFDNIRKFSEWEDMYELAKRYYEHNGDLEVPCRFKTINGVDYEEDGVNLGRWLANQRANKKLSEEKKEKLGLIGMRFDNIRQKHGWEEMYELAKKYYEYHGNLQIPARFKTINGIDYDENGFNLGKWLTNLKSRKRIDNLSEEKIKLLELIGVNINEIDVNLVHYCVDLGININKNKDILVNYTFDEFKKKLDYLIRNGETNIVDENGRLHFIFTSVSNELEDNNGLDLDTQMIINNYLEEGKQK